MIAVYAVAERSEAPLPEGLFALEQGAVAAIYAPAGDAASEPAADALWRHENVIESLMEGRTVLPMRFGSLLESEEELRGVLAERAGEFERLLDSVRGRVELAVRVLAAEPDSPESPTSSGREYMEGLLSRRREQQETAAIVRPLETLADEARLRESHESNVARWAFLVDRERVEDFRAELERVKQSNPDVAVACTGPWPPYSFVGDER